MRQFNPGGRTMLGMSKRCAAGVAAIVRMGPLSIKSSRRRGEGAIWRLVLLPLGVHPGRASSPRHNFNRSKYVC